MSTFFLLSGCSCSLHETVLVFTQIVPTQIIPPVKQIGVSLDLLERTGLYGIDKSRGRTHLY